MMTRSKRGRRFSIFSLSFCYVLMNTNHATVDLLHLAEMSPNSPFSFPSLHISLFEFCSVAVAEALQR